MSTSWHIRRKFKKFKKNENGEKRVMIINQGAKANFSGSKAENQVNEYLNHHGFTVTQGYEYRAIWFNKRLNKADLYIHEIDTVVECKFQESAGTTDQKGPAELYNAGQKIKAKNYILLLLGTWWDKGRGMNIYEACKEMASTMCKNRGDWLKQLEDINVMKSDEFKSWIKSQKNT